MNEGLQPNNDIEKYRREKYEEFRKEIENFRDLPELTFSNVRPLGGDKLEPERAKAISVSAMSDRFHNASLTPEQVIELEDLWSQTFYGDKPKRD